MRRPEMSYEHDLEGYGRLGALKGLDVVPLAACLPVFPCGSHVS